MIIYDWNTHPEPEGWGDFIDLAPLSGDCSTLSDEEVALRLAVLLSQISEELWCATWHTDLGAWSLRWAEGVDLPAGLDPDLPDVLHRARGRLNGRWVDCRPGVGVVLREVGDE